MEKIIKLFLTLFVILNYAVSKNLNPSCNYNYKQARHVPQTEYLGAAYNVYEGNPRGKEDLGYKGKNPLEFSLGNEVSDDGNWAYPKGMKVSSLQQGDLSYVSNTMYSMSKYRDSIKASVSISGGFPFGSFSASAGYKNMKEKFQTSQNVSVEQNAECAVFLAGIYENTSSQPSISLQLVQWLKKMYQAGDSSTSYYDFFDNWGTHVVTNIKLGSIFVKNTELSISGAQEMQSKGYDIEASASYFGTSGSLSLEQNSDRGKSFSSAFKSENSYYIGAKPSSNATEWASQSVITPMPIKISLIPYQDLIKIYTKRDNKGLNDSAIKQISLLLEKYSKTYCSERLQRNKSSQECNDPDMSIFGLRDPKMYSSFIDRVMVGLSQFKLTYYDSGVSMYQNIPADEKLQFGIYRLQVIDIDSFKIRLIPSKIDKQFQIENQKKCIEIISQNFEFNDCQKNNDNQIFEVIPYNKEQQLYKIRNIITGIFIDASYNVGFRQNEYVFRISQLD